MLAGFICSGVAERGGDGLYSSEPLGRLRRAREGKGGKASMGEAALLSLAISVWDSTSIQSRRWVSSGLTCLAFRVGVPTLSIILLTNLVSFYFLYLPMQRRACASSQRRGLQGLWNRL